MGELEKIENTISEHAVSIAIMSRAVSSIESLLTQQTISIKEIEKAMKSQELLMEKFTHLDTRISDSVNRLHKRLDDTDNALSLHKRATKDMFKEIAEEHKTKCDEVMPMAMKGESIHKGMVFIAKSLGVLVIGMIFALMVWTIKASDYTPQGQ